MFWKLTIVFVMAALSGCCGDEKLYQCKFERIGGKYEVMETELKRTTTLILVRQDDRSHMFKRDKLFACEELQPTTIGGGNNGNEESHEKENRKKGPQESRQEDREQAESGRKGNHR